MLEKTPDGNRIVLVRPNLETAEKLDDWAVIVRPITPQDPDVPASFRQTHIFRIGEFISAFHPPRVEGPGMRMSTDPARRWLASRRFTNQGVETADDAGEPIFTVDNEGITLRTAVTKSPFMAGRLCRAKFDGNGVSFIG
ncbi:hypothetical protein H696_02627 [Fonticula alba]|uniref:Uncharacterized protein n=1 Tax=Fonticula alba TaxID=691883 RepID=A0A058Z8P5_FONAL|nr:hypothetical protein H696_02627 [Fonticula alba]KCV70298.1 hypothetical protein H696_02627 [Fonticula alba]|eukprot:XP_009494814.1 hypothetical protein H696_02627 [Fonticula alba]